MEKALQHGAFPVSICGGSSIVYASVWRPAFDAPAWRRRGNIWRDWRKNRPAYRRRRSAFPAFPASRRPAAHGRREVPRFGTSCTAASRKYPVRRRKEYYSLCHQSSEPFEVLSPKCVVIIGKMASLTPGQVAAFENFRNSLSNVLILTFDELYQRIVDLIAVLSESPNQQPGIFEPETGNEDLPF